MALLPSDIHGHDYLVERHQVQEEIWAMHLSNVSSFRKCTPTEVSLGGTVVGCYLCSEFGLGQNLILLFRFFFKTCHPYILGKYHNYAIQRIH